MNRYDSCTIGWIGAGTLGLALVDRLLSKGQQLILYNRTRSKVDHLASKHLSIAKTPSEIFSCSNVIFMCLSDKKAINEILSVTSYDSGNSKSKTVVNISTIDPGFSIELKNHFSHYSINYLDAPVSGGREGAIAGNLATICSGDEKAYLKVRSILDLFSREIHFYPGDGKAQSLKLINNLSESINLASASEILKIGKNLGFSMKELAPVLTSARGKSDYMSLLIDKIMNDDIGVVDVSLDIRLKDINLALKLVGDGWEDSNPLLNQAVEIFNKAYKKYGGCLDQTIVYLEEMNKEAIAI